MTAPTTKKKPAAPPAPPPDPNDTLNLWPWQRAELDAQALYWLHLKGKPATLAEAFDGHRPRWAAEALARCEARGLVTAIRKGRDEAAETRWEIGFLGLVELYSTLRVEVRGVRRPLTPVF